LWVTLFPLFLSLWLIVWGNMYILLFPGRITQKYEEDIYLFYLDLLIFVMYIYQDIWRFLHHSGQCTGFENRECLNKSTERKLFFKVYEERYWNVIMIPRYLFPDIDTSFLCINFTVFHWRIRLKILTFPCFCTYVWKLH
jgi:hypothetical protein